MRSAIADPSTIVAALGPTNTGKTHRAVERLLEHRTGMIGLPLRLLAREVYDRITARIGEQQVALITGEEKRIPRRPRYWVCTTEAMPVDRPVDFVAVDEIQLAAHPQRGHVFTDRLLHARGRLETWFMGADTMRPLLEQLLPTAEFRRQPRFSKLTSRGRIPLKSLPPRTAVVGFSSTQIYELAERLRRRRGGTAVVLGALSPRTRNAQVAMYQAGEVQYLVATDAIGMGLNMDVDLVAFAALRKFDGERERALEPAELAQIAGRAGRHMNDGSFATVAPLPALPDPIVLALETHQFPPIRRIFWRNSELDLSSIDALIATLKKRPRRDVLRLVERAEDFDALLALVAQPEVRGLAQTPERVALLWDVCQIPDFRQLLLESHARLLGELFVQFCQGPGALSSDWMARRVARLNDTQGDIDALLMRIAFIRTWTYVANHRDWVVDAEHWQQATREIEDRLSDALHERLVHQFVARATVGGARRSPRRAPPRAAADTAPTPPVSAHHPFRALANLRVPSAPTQHAQLPTVDAWLEDAVQAEHDRFSVNERGLVLLDGERVARMTRGVDLLRPDAVVTVDDELGAGARLRLQRRVLAFIRDRVELLMAPLRGDLGAISPTVRGLVYRLEQGLGTLWTRDVRQQLAVLSSADRAALRTLRVIVGARMVYVRALLEPQAVLDRTALCVAFFELRKPPALPPPEATSVVVDSAWEHGLYLKLGHPVLGGRAIRADVVERVQALVGRHASRGPCAQPAEVAAWLGCSAEEAKKVIEALGYAVNAEGQLVPPPRRRKRRSGTGLR